MVRKCMYCCEYSLISYKLISLLTLHVDDKDLDHYIQEAGYILGLGGKSSKEVLIDIGAKIFQHKMETIESV